MSRTHTVISLHLERVCPLLYHTRTWTHDTETGTAMVTGHGHLK